MLNGVSTPHADKSARGFTLIELLITLTLLGVLMGLGVPSFLAWIRNTQVRTVAEALQAGIRTAQTEAVRRNRTVMLSFTNATPAQDAAILAGGKNWSLQTVPSLGDTQARFIAGGALADVASGVAIAGNGTAVSAICFNANGRLVANASGCTQNPVAFDITQTSADRPLRVTVQVGGQIRMCDPNRPTLSATSPDGCPAL